MHVYIYIYIYQLPKLCCTKLRKKIFQGTTKEACPLCFLRLSGMASTSEGFLPLGGSKLYRHHGFQYEILSTWMIWGNINFRKPQIMINMDYNIILTSYYIILTIWKLPILYLAGGAITIKKNMKVSWDDDIPNILENKKCSKPPTRYHIISYIRLWFIIITKKSTVYLCIPPLHQPGRKIAIWRPKIWSKPMTTMVKPMGTATKTYFPFHEILVG
jgi:hypothetical protein